MIDKIKILNAINEGIKSSFKFSSNKDDSSSIDFSDSKINKVNSLTLQNLIRETGEDDFIDLGLSVKWAKCNIGATCQDTAKSWYGNYYAWGEIKIKLNYTDNSYDLTLYEKYNENDFHILLPEDDVVTLTYYGVDKFRMPTKEEYVELLAKTKKKWKTNYQGIEGLNGIEFTSKTTGNSIFIPAAGYLYDSDFCSIGFYCHSWSSSFSSDLSNSAWCLGTCYKSISKKSSVCDCYRRCGFPIRGVCS